VASLQTTPESLKSDLPLRRLVRIISIPLDEGVDAWTRQESIYLQYQSCVDAGWKDKADIVLRTLLGPAERRPRLAHAPAHVDEYTPDAIPDSEQYCKCGHKANEHSLGTMWCHHAQVREGQEWVCKCKGFVLQGTREPSPTGTCACSHSKDEHPGGGECANVDCLCVLYRP